MKLAELKRGHVYDGVDLYVLGMWIAVFTHSQIGINLGIGRALYWFRRGGFMVCRLHPRYTFLRKLWQLLP